MGKTEMPAIVLEVPQILGAAIVYVKAYSGNFTQVYRNKISSRPAKYCNKRNLKFTMEHILTKIMLQGKGSQVSISPGICKR